MKSIVGVAVIALLAAGVSLSDGFGPADWYPGDHPKMPDVVAHGRRPDVHACSLCHYPNGKGRPENAGVAGLPTATARALNRRRLPRNGSFRTQLVQLERKPYAATFSRSFAVAEAIRLDTANQE
jgi:hypothetical protein